MVLAAYGLAGAALERAGSWCDILILHLNVKQCRASGAPGGETLAVAIGRKYDQPIEDTYGVRFRYEVRAARADYLQVVLDADAGPFGTRDYRLALEAAPLEGGRTFMHLAYSYRYGLAARIALEGYLQTLGRGKVGFSVVGRDPDGHPIHVGGLRGLAERNAMRYFLAVEVYTRSLRAPPPERLETRLLDWFAETERYAPQLHELERDDYLAMKRREIARQGAP